jgi:putative membrane protein
MDSQDKPIVTQALSDHLGVWQRLAPISILYFVGSTLKAVVGNMLFVLPAFAISFSQFSQAPLLWLSGLSVFILLLFVSAAFNYYFYQYRLQNDSVEIRSGVLAKKNINLPFSKIQNVKLEQPFYYRMTQFVCMELDTAGSSQQEAKIVALKIELADQLKRKILQNHNDIDEQTALILDECSDDIDTPTVLNKRSLQDLVIHGITNNRVWIILGVAAPLFNQIADQFNNVLTSWGIDIEQLVNSETIIWWQFALFALTTFVLISVLLGLLSVLGAIFVFYDFTLIKSGDRYIRKSGLLTKQEVSMKLTRLQIIVRKQDWLDIILGRINLYLEQNQTGQQNPNAITSANKILIPSVMIAECKFLINDALPRSRSFEQNYQQISKRFMFRLICYWIFPFLVVSSLATLLQGHWDAFVLVLILSIIASCLVVLRWYRWGYGADGEFIYVRKGLFGVDYFCFPIAKIQQTHFRQSVLMKRHGLAHCQFILASGEVTIPFLPESNLRQLIDRCLYQIESEKRPWM